MGAFEFVAVDAAGRERRGVLEGDTPRHVRQQLREQGLLPVGVTEVLEQEGSRERRQFSFKLQRGLSAADLALVTRQLATLVKSALPLEEALLAVSQQTDKPRVRSILLGVPFPVSSTAATLHPETNPGSIPMIFFPKIGG